MSNIFYIFCKWIPAMEPGDERCLDLMKPSKEIATEIHPHYNEVFTWLLYIRIYLMRHEP